MTNGQSKPITILQHGKHANWLPWKEETADAASKEFGQQARFFRTGVPYVRPMPDEIIIPGGTAAQTNAARSEIAKAFTNACLRDQEQRPAFFAWIIDRISDYSKSVLRARPGHDACLLYTSDAADE